MNLCDYMSDLGFRHIVANVFVYTLLRWFSVNLANKN